MPTIIKSHQDFTAPALLFEALESGEVRCTACAHSCRIHPGREGICKVRFNRDGVLRVPWGYVSTAHADPVEKKPFYHLLPGRRAFTFGMLGCNLHCDFCQNWNISQVLRDAAAGDGSDYIQPVGAAELAAVARRSGSAMMVSSYNEPIITSEWAAEIFKESHKLGLRTAMVSNGYATLQTLRFLAPYLTALKIDLKTMQDHQYRSLGGVLTHVLETIQQAHELGLWVEVVTLVIPDFNDSPEELWQAASFLASVSRDVPWHVTAYHPDYRRNTDPTGAASLQRAADIGEEAGLHYVYAGNLPGRVGSLEDTRCPQCTTRLVERRGFNVLENRITPQGTCPKCGAKIPGIWN